MGATEQIVLGAILFLLGAILIGIISENVVSKTGNAFADSEVIDITTARITGNQINVTGGDKQYFSLANRYSGDDVWKTEYSDCNVNAIAYGNTTPQTTYWVEDTDYSVSSSGVLRLYNTTHLINATSNTTYIDYTYCPDEYVTSPWGRSILHLMGGMMALMLIASAIAIFFRVYQSAKGF